MPLICEMLAGGYKNIVAFCSLSSDQVHVCCQREQEEQVLQAFSNREIKQDDDINITLEQAEKTALKEEGLSYPELKENGKFDYDETLNFLEQLAEKFKWDEYEPEDLGKKNLNGEYSLLR